jgi:GNAT superfamily N-acetyltransferase
MSASFSVRRATTADVDEIAAVHGESIATLGATRYAAHIVSEWGRGLTGARYAAALGRGEIFFIAVGEATLGFSSYRLEDGKHRTAIYVAGRAARCGVGTALFRAAEAVAIAQGARELHVDASLVAVEFYLANGFEELGRGDHPMGNGDTMPCVFMRKTL